MGGREEKERKRGERWRVGERKPLLVARGGERNPRPMALPWRVATAEYDSRRAKGLVASATVVVDEERYKVPVRLATLCSPIMCVGDKRFWQVP